MVVGNYRWTPEDNAIAEVELKLSTILTRELTARPEVSLNMLYAIQNVRAQVQPLLLDLEARIKKALKAQTMESRQDGRRFVTVIIKGRNEP